MKSSITDGPLSIGDLAAHFGLATHVLRHWEAVGLLVPSARVSGRRRYGRPHVARVALILRGKQAGLSLPAIREVLEARDRAARQAILTQHHDAIERQIAELCAARRLIEHAMACPADDVTSCPKLQAMLLGSIAADEPGTLTGDRQSSRLTWSCDGTGEPHTPTSMLDRQNAPSGEGASWRRRRDSNSRPS